MSGLDETFVHRYEAEAGKNAGIAIYALPDDRGNIAFFTPQQLLNIFDYVLQRHGSIALDRDSALRIMQDKQAKKREFRL